MHAAHTRVSLFLTTIALAGLAGGLLYAVAAPPGAARADSVIAVDSTSQGLGVPGCTLPEAILAANHDATSVPLPSSNGLSFETGCAAGSGNDLIDLVPGTYAFPDVIDDASNYVGPAATPIITSPLQSRRGILSDCQGLKAVSWIRQKPVITSVEFQNLPSFSWNCEAIVDSAL